MEDSRHNKRLLLGYGDIAQRLAKISLAREIPVTAVRRKLDLQSDIDLIAGDVTKPEILKPFLAEEGPVDIVITLTPDNYSEQGYRDCYLACAQTLAETLPACARNSRVIFVSSTSVYGQNSGEWVDESSDCSPTSETAKVLLETEAVISSIGVQSCNLRFSGIYGPGRTRIIERVKSGKIPSAHPAHWTNRIHADDCARVIDQLLQQSNAEFPGCLLASDTLPSPRADVQSYIAQQLGITVSIQDSGTDAAEPTGKRCSSKKLTGLGFEFLYPDFRVGFSALIK